MTVDLPSNLHHQSAKKIGRILLLISSSWLLLFVAGKLSKVQAQNQFFSQISSESGKIQQPELNLSLSPPITYLSIRPGETKSYQLTLQNSGTRNLQVQLQLADFESDNQTGQPILKPNSKFNYLKPRDKAWNWQTPQLLKSGETVKIWLDVTAPASVMASEYHLTILAQAAATSENPNFNSSDSIGSSGSVTGLIGSNLVLAIAKDSVNLSQIFLEDWQFPKFVDSLGEIDIKGLVKNSGNQAGPIIGKATFAGPDGKILKTWLIYPDMVLPNTTRAVRVVDITSDPSANPDTWFTLPNLVLSNNLNFKPRWLFGNYIFKIQLFKQNYSETQAKSEKTVQITALPFGIVAIIFAIPICFWLMNFAKAWFAKTMIKSISNN